MRIVISLVIAIASFFAVGVSLFEFAGRDHDFAVGAALAAAILAFIISMNKVQIGKSGIDMASDALSAVKEAKENIQSTIDARYGDLYAVAEEEYEKGEIDKGLWSQALIKSKGDERLRKVEYMKLRVMQLKRRK